MRLEIFPPAENARQRGYAYVCDLSGEFIEENWELLASLRPEGCVLGEASGENRDEALGLYPPAAPRSLGRRECPH